MKSTEKGFTLVELLVVLGMIGMLMAALSSSVIGAQRRAKAAKAESEVKVISQAILAYENYDRKRSLPTMTNRDADQGAIGFLIGQGGAAESGGKIPAVLMAQLTAGGKMLDPWNTPYKISIREGGANVRMSSASGAMQTGFYFPNFYRLREEERK